MFWRQLFDGFKYLILQKELSEKHSWVLQKQQIEIVALKVAVTTVAFEISRLHENERHEREKLTLQLEVQLLKDRALLPAHFPNTTDYSDLEQRITEVEEQLAELRDEVNNLSKR